MPLRAFDEPTMLVVLPLSNLGSPDEADFTAGLTQEIRGRLSVLDGIRVISERSSTQYAAGDKTVEQIGRELGVDHVLEGSVRWAPGEDAERVRIDLQLIRVDDDTLAWNRTYDSLLDDIFAVQSDIAEQVSEQLGLALEPSDAADDDLRPTSSIEAYLAYLGGITALAARG